MNESDHDLLKEFAERRSETAFRRLVERHLGMVFGVAKRVTGDAHLAEEISQSTFATLARKAAGLTEKEALGGWLYHTARHLALRAVRSEQRRRQRESIAATMNLETVDPDSIAEHLESAMDVLKAEDRDAIVLRFFENRDLRDVGRQLGLSEDAARMRVNRALERLRGVLVKLGFTGSAAWLAAALPTSASATVPASLAAAITSTV